MWLWTLFCWLWWIWRLQSRRPSGVHRIGDRSRYDILHVQQGIILCRCSETVAENQSFDWEDTKIIDRDSCTFIRKIWEAIHIRKRQSWVKSLDLDVNGCHLDINRSCIESVPDSKHVFWANFGFPSVILELVWSSWPVLGQRWLSIGCIVFKSNIGPTLDHYCNAVWDCSSDRNHNKSSTAMQRIRSRVIKPSDEIMAKAKGWGYTSLDLTDKINSVTFSTILQYSPTIR